jgi:hypothetical protein
MARSVLLVSGLLAGLAAMLALGTADAADPAFCGKYSSEALKSVQAAKQLKCGFGGPRWNNNQGLHMGWCLASPPQAAHFESAARASALKLCTCDWYANHTMVQVWRNIAEKCGFGGVRWLESRKAHYEWCKNVNPPFHALKNELDIRKKMLKGC